MLFGVSIDADGYPRYVPLVMDGDGAKLFCANIGKATTSAVTNADIRSRVFILMNDNPGPLGEL
jgi:hypothetical protein